MSDLGVVVRPATDADLPLMADLLSANDESAESVSIPANAWDPYLRHMLARGTVLIAATRAGEPLAFGASIDTGRAIHLSDLFVVRTHLGRGIGGVLMAQLLGDRFPRTTFASDDPRAMALYVRAGMTPLWPNLYLSRDSAPAGQQVNADGGAASVGRDARPEELAELELVWTGVDRRADHNLWPVRRGGRSFVVERDRIPIGVGHARARILRSGRWIDRFVCAPDASDEAVVDATLAAMAFGAIADGTTAIGACVPGPHVALPRLLGLGFRIVDRDTFLASDPGLLDATRTLVDTGIP